VGAALARGRPHRGGRARHVERRPPARHPIHLAKSAATVDRLSDGRVVLGVASGDRDPEYAAFGVDPEKRGEMVRERIAAMRACWREDFPEIDGEWGELGGDLDVLPKPTTETLPVLPTGNARQSTEWIAEHGDGWLFYHLPDETLRSYVAEWRELAGAKPFSIAVGVEFADDPTAEPEPSISATAPASTGSGSTSGGSTSSGSITSSSTCAATTRRRRWRRSRTR